MLRAILFLILFKLGVQICPGASLLFRNGTIHPVSGPVLTNADFWIEGAVIKGVGTNLKSSTGQTVDLNGKHVFPGLIAAATSAGLVEIDMVRSTRDLSEVGEYTPDVRAWMAVNPDSELLPVARANGITHIVPVPNGGIVAGQSGLVSLHGWTVEDMTVKAPLALHVFWPSMSLDTTPKEQLADKSKFKSFEEQAKEREEKIKSLDDFFSEAEAYAKSRKQEESVPAWEAMLPFVNGKIPLMVHADDYRQIKAAVEWAGQRKYKMILAGARDAWMVADLLAKEKVPVIFERIYNMGGPLGATPARDFDPYDVHFRAPGVLHKAGVKVIIGMGLGGQVASELRNLPYYAAQAVAFGLPEEEGLKAITLYPAEILQVNDRLGSLEPGKEATFVIADGNILDNRTHVEEVWIRGEKTSPETRHTRLYEKYRNRPKKK
jgi:imidazolonepropionase-like amidohydrolase